MLTNTEPTGLAEGLAATFIDCALEGKPTRDWIALYKQVFSNPAVLGIHKTFDFSRAPDSVSPAAALAAYTGKYANKLYGDIEVATRDGALVLVQGPKKESAALRHYDRDTFVYETVGENASGLSGITFRIGPDGKASSALIEHLDEFGQGVFSRAGG